MNLYEYEAKRIFAEGGIPVPPSVRVTKPEELAKVHFGYPLTLKCQVLSGGRGNAAEDVEEDDVDIGVVVDQLESGQGFLLVRAAAGIQEIARVAAEGFDHVHGGHGKTGAVAENADIAVEFNQVQALHFGCALSY